MSDTSTQPFVLEVQPSARKSGMFEWTIRRHGKLLERSDRLERTEDDARKGGAKALDRHLASSHGER